MSTTRSGHLLFNLGQHAAALHASVTWKGEAARAGGVCCVLSGSARLSACRKGEVTHMVVI